MEEPQPGFRFYPTEEELVSFYLQNKVEGRRVQEINRVIPVVDIYEYNPWELPQFAGEGCPKDTEQWFFFIPMQEREVPGGRTNRLTSEGYWKATGSPGYVYSFSDNPPRATIIGAKRTMVFYKGRAPNGRRTRWKMIEYKSILEALEASSSKLLPQKLRQELSVCRVYIKSKCVRAFDRRPMPAAAAAQQPHYCHGNLQLQTPVLLPERRASDDHDSRGGRSSSSSFSGDDHYCSHADAAVVMENGNGNLTLLMPADNNSEPLWDWEHLINWS